MLGHCLTNLPSPTMSLVSSAAQLKVTVFNWTGLKNWPGKWTSGHTWERLSRLRLPSEKVCKGLASLH